ncbi:DUF45 domain-containing protein [Candidatus Peregrinibacteria bacterium]|nr:DUF45 domain-containing protein [Candidatus Peregrinibacteria bacterium]
MFKVKTQIKMDHEIKLENQKFQLRIAKKINIKNIHIKIKQPQIISISCNKFTSTKQIINAIEKHKNWIIKANQNVNNKIAYQYIEGERHFYMGKLIPLNITLSHHKRSKIHLENGIFKIRISYDLSTQQQKRQIKKLLDNFYKDTTQKQCLETINDLQMREHKAINVIRFKNLKSRWGSCSSSNNLNFNLNLAKLPVEVQRYIYVHEYAHLFYLNHSTKFWNKIEEFLPDYKKHKDWLKMNENYYIN